MKDRLVSIISKTNVKRNFMYPKGRSDNAEHRAKPLVIAFNSFTIVIGTASKYVDHRIVSTSSVLTLHKDHQQQ